MAGAAHMAEWNTFYRNEEDEEDQEEGEQSGGESKASSLLTTHQLYIMQQM